ncbi:hypothetical protein SNEBB_006234 [Seison nebaliae]|nr:hypothetical protein SNEBB_006234 [Seison nebaliae]
MFNSTNLPQNGFQVAKLIYHYLMPITIIIFSVTNILATIVIRFSSLKRKKIFYCLEIQTYIDTLILFLNVVPAIFNHSQLPKNYLHLCCRLLVGLRILLMHLSAFITTFCCILKIINLKKIRFKRLEKLKIFSIICNINFQVLMIAVVALILSIDYINDLSLTKIGPINICHATILIASVILIITYVVIPMLSLITSSILIIHHLTSRKNIIQPVIRNHITRSTNSTSFKSNHSQSKRMKHKYEGTVGIDFLCKTIHIGEQAIRLQFWDTAGQERFRALTPSYMQDSTAAVIVYDVTSKSSFDETKTWINDFRKKRGNDVLIFLVGNKIDLVQERQITTEQGEARAKKNKIQYFETSAKTGENISKLFMNIGKSMPGVEDINADQIPRSVENITVEEPTKEAQNAWCYC